MNQAMPWDLLPAYVRPGGQAETSNLPALTERQARIAHVETVFLGFYFVAFAAGAYGGYRLVKRIAR